MQNRAAVLPVSITSDAGELIRHQPHKFTQYWPFQCLSCGSSLAGQSDHTDLVPPEVGIVDKQAMVEDWLNPESEGEFAPQVQHYKPGQAGGSNCDCPPPPGISPQQKISKVSQISYPDLTWPSVQTVDEQYLRSGGPVRASPRSPQGGGGPSSLPSRAGKRKSRDTDSKGSMVSQSARQAVLLINYLFRLSKRQARQRDARDQKLARPTRMASIGKFYWELFFISNMFFGKLTKLIECIVCKLSNKPTTIWFFIEFLNFLKTIFMKYII